MKGYEPIWIMNKIQKFLEHYPSSRLKILDILSCGEKCACDILEYFNFNKNLFDS